MGVQTVILLLLMRIWGPKLHALGKDSIVEVWGLKTALTDHARAILLI